jgi:hypothetical protein
MLSVVATGAMADTARLQVIHNSPDPGAGVVDVYVNGDLFIDEFAFRAATPFVDVPAGVTLEIGVAPGGASTPNDIIGTFPVVLDHGKTYVAIANGVLVPDDFDTTVNGSGIAFTIVARDKVKEAARRHFLVDLLAFHGSPDAPAVDVMRDNYPWRPLFGNLAYGEFSAYRSVFPWMYTLDITPAGDNNTVVASFEADLSGLGGGAAVVFASGFLNPAANQNGPAFGLFAALPTGDVVELPAVQKTAMVQVIHNAADPAAAVVDIYLDDVKIVPDFAFRAATPFVELPADVEIVIGVAPGGSGGPEEIIAEFPVTLEGDETYVVFANGVLDPMQFAENPESADISFQLYPQGHIRPNRFPWLVKLIGFHGASDAPTVDILRKSGNRYRRLINDLSYGEYSKDRYLLAKQYRLAVTPGGDNSTIVAEFEANLTGLGGGSAVVFASGFLSPGDNNNGEAFGLFVALGDGTVIALPAVGAKMAKVNPVSDDTKVLEQTSLGQNYPNPFNPTTTINFSLAERAKVSLSVFNAQGQLVELLVEGETLDAGLHSVPFDASGMASGVYFYRLDAGSVTQKNKMILMK